MGAGAPQLGVVCLERRLVSALSAPTALLARIQLAKYVLLLCTVRVYSYTRSGLVQYFIYQ